MIKQNLKNEKGITMITLALTVLILIILTSALAINSYDSMQISNLTRLENDISTLNNRIASYYVSNDDLPLYGEAMTKSYINTNYDIKDLSINDGDVYYLIDLSKLENLTLNYGEDYTMGLSNAYIINVESHIIYYLKGVKYEGEIYHTVGNNPGVFLNRS